MSESAQIAMQGSMPFHRIGVLKLSNITFQNGTLGILPPGKKKQQKFVIGDSSGTVSVYYVKKGNASAEWQNPMADKPIPGAPVDPVSCIFVEPNRDKIYAAAGKRIKCFSRKGHVNVSLDVGQDVRGSRKNHIQHIKFQLRPTSKVRFESLSTLFFVEKILMIDVQIFFF